jgi:hypothetical protein
MREVGTHEVEEESVSEGKRRGRQEEREGIGRL